MRVQIVSFEYPLQGLTGRLHLTCNDLELFSQLGIAGAIVPPRVEGEGEEDGPDDDGSLYQDAQPGDGSD